MPIRYHDLGENKRLRDIVFAGSHDASITTGKRFVQTQALDIGGQAAAGVRLFDLRILARTTNTPGGKRGELVGYHGSHKEKDKTRQMVALGEDRDIARSKMKTGGFGLGLEGMLTQAANFVRGSTEFLILKFDKCTNWNLIAETCVAVLGNTIYTGGGAINRKKLKELAGKVIVVFSTSGLRDATDYGSQDGILGFKNLYSKGEPPGAFDMTFDGLQYFGKGGTKIFGGGYRYTTKVSENEKKQGKLMSQMAGALDNHSSDVLGMMYWTTTGSTGSIERRNATMWTAAGVQKLEALWNAGLDEAIETRSAANRVKATHYSSGSMLKTFMPNIVMIDFADEDKCQTIYDLNTIANTKLVDAYRLAHEGEE